MGNMKEMADGLRTLKKLQKQIGNVDMSNPQQILDTLGIDIDELDKQFTESMSNQKLTLEYSYKSVNPEPSYAYPTDSGFDLRSTIKVTLGPLERSLVPTGLFLNIPENYEIQIIF